MIYITTKNVKQIIRDSQEVKNDLLKNNEQLENELDQTSKSLQYWKNKAAKLESDLFDSSIKNNLYDKGIVDGNRFYKICAYNPKPFTSKFYQNNIRVAFGGKFDTKPIYTFNQLVKKIKETNTDLSCYVIVRVRLQ